MSRNVYTLCACLAAMLALFPLPGRGQDVIPSAMPVMAIVDDDGMESEESSYEGSAPVTAIFRAQPENVGNYTPYYEWRFSRQGEEKPFLTRYEEETQYVFKESGAFVIELYVSFVQGTDTIEYEIDEPFVVNISESKLELPNAFTPNGDGINDVFKVKEGYQSIISFEAKVFSRWGKKLYEWNDIEGGWDGRSGGRDVPDGAYYLVVKAKGADGKDYDIKKVINILRGYTENGSSE